MPSATDEYCRVSVNVAGTSSSRIVPPNVSTVDVPAVPIDTVNASSGSSTASSMIGRATSANVWPAGIVTDVGPPISPGRSVVTSTVRSLTGSPPSVRVTRRLMTPPFSRYWLPTSRFVIDSGTSGVTVTG